MNFLFLLLCGSAILGTEGFNVPISSGPTSFRSSLDSCRSTRVGCVSRGSNLKMGIFSGHDSDKRIKKTSQGSNALRTLLRKTRTRLQNVLLWQRKRRRGVLAAVAVSLSVLFLTDENLMGDTSSVSVHNSQSGSARAEIHRAAPSVPSSTLSMARGGQSVSTRSRISGLNLFSKTASSSATRKTPLPLASAQNAKVVDITDNASRSIREALSDLGDFLDGPKKDTLLLLGATALITPICKRFGTSPILGFLAAGMLLGPNGCGLISGIHTTETLAELGIVFFLFEMGIELSAERLMSMKKDVFGLGMAQFLITAAAVAGTGSIFFKNLSGSALVVLGGGLALSSSAFVLQLLKDKDQMASRFGKASFGVLLFQDLAVVPLLVVTPILAGTGTGVVAAVSDAMLKAAMALGSIAFAGRYLLNPLFKTVAAAKSQEAFLGVILLTVLGMSFLTEGLGLSNTLGAFLAGVLLSETKYRYQIEADIAPFRGVLLGLFFITVGFEIDLHLIAMNFPMVSGVVLGIMALKATIATLLSLAFGLSLSNSQQVGLMLSQGGEFAFVAFGLARSLGIFDAYTTKFLLTCVSLTMALTPLLVGVGAKIATKLEEKTDFVHYIGQDNDAMEIKGSEDFVVVVGYGVVGKVVCDLLDRKFYKYVGVEVDPNKAIQARNKGLPVFFGDVGRPDVAEAFEIGKAKSVIVTIADKGQANRAIISLRRLYPDLKIFARASDADHASRLQKTLDVIAMVPILPEDNLLLTLPFGGAVLRSLGAPSEEVNAILETKRKELLTGRGLDKAEQEMMMSQLGISAQKDDKKECIEPQPAEKKSMVAEFEDTLKEDSEKEILDAELIDDEDCEITVNDDSDSIEEIVAVTDQLLDGTKNITELIA